jgi:hypothetical protein
MNLIRKILLESEEDNFSENDFFKPKKIEQRTKRREEERKEFLPKIILGLKNIKTAYQNKNWENKKEELFLEIFSKFHLNKKFDDEFVGYRLLDQSDHLTAILGVNSSETYLSIEYVWDAFESKSKEFSREPRKLQLFIKSLFKKYFKIDTMPYPSDFVN